MYGYGVVNSLCASLFAYHLPKHTFTDVRRLLSISKKFICSYPYGLEGAPLHSGAYFPAHNFEKIGLLTDYSCFQAVRTCEDAFKSGSLGKETSRLYLN